MQSNNIENKILTKNTIVHCSCKQAWEYWTTYEGLKQFFGQENKVELQLGGAFEIYFLMDNDKGLQGSEGCKIISFIPEEMLSFTWNAPPDFQEIRNHPHQTWVVVNFQAINESSTQITLKHLGWLHGQDWDYVYDYFETAWEMVLSNLTNLINDDD